MSGWSSKSEVLDVLKESIRQSDVDDMPTDPRAYNLSAILRECFVYQGRTYGWHATDQGCSPDGFRESLKRNVR